MIHLPHAKGITRRSRPEAAEPYFRSSALMPREGRQIGSITYRDCGNEAVPWSRNASVCRRRWWIVLSMRAAAAGESGRSECVMRQIVRVRSGSISGRKTSFRSLAAALAASAHVGRAEAQPEPSFRSTCGGLRAALNTLDMRGDPLVTIQVEGRLTHVQADEALVYLVLCSPPDPQVLCVTYRTNGRKAGDSVVVVGSYTPRGPNHVQLDPCLHHLPGQGSR
jgi:hypothetical protein